MTLQRLVITYTRDGIQLRTLYRSKDGPRPQTKARRREVEQLVRSGLTAALEALDAGDVEMVGTAGFTTREDTLLATASSDSEKSMRRGA